MDRRCGWVLGGLWTLFWGTGNSLPAGTYPRILLLVLGIIYMAVPVAAGMALGAALGAGIGYILGRAVTAPRKG